MTAARHAQRPVERYLDTRNSESVKMKLVYCENEIVMKLLSNSLRSLCRL